MATPLLHVDSGSTATSGLRTPRRRAQIPTASVTPRGAVVLSERASSASGGQGPPARLKDVAVQPVLSPLSTMHGSPRELGVLVGSTQASASSSLLLAAASSRRQQPPLQRVRQLEPLQVHVSSSSEGTIRSVASPPATARTIQVSATATVPRAPSSCRLGDSDSEVPVAASSNYDSCSDSNATASGTCGGASVMVPVIELPELVHIRRVASASLLKQPTNYSESSSELGAECGGGLGDGIDSDPVRLLVLSLLSLSESFELHPDY